ncbi:MAG: GGDEF domain-containing phosphodiesterase [Gammaproteobacteria bacterium]
MNQITAVPVIVVSRFQERAEAINSCLRNGGHPARVLRLDDAGDLQDHLPEDRWQLAVVFADEGDGLLANVARVLSSAGREIPLVSCREHLSESGIGADMGAGAHDGVTLADRQRLLAVLERELKMARLDQALREAVESASQHREQLRRVMAGTADAIAHVGEGIVLDTNQAWRDAFARQGEDDLTGLPFMDLFETDSHPAVKGALVACAQGKWPAEEKVKAMGRGNNGRPISASLEFEPATFDGEPCVRVRVPARPNDDEALAERLQAALKLDHETGLYGRTFFFEQLAERLEEDPPGGVRALVLIAVDDVPGLEKQVGVTGLDTVLAGLADLLRDVVQSRDLYGRIGTGQFAALVARGNRKDLQAWAETVLAKSARTLFEAGGKSVSVSLSAGLAVVEDREKNVDRVHAEAREALDRAVDLGGGQMALSRKGEDSTRIEQMDQLWIKRIKHALMENRFRLALQPIASLSGEENELYDLLVRMLDEQQEEILPGEFMPPAQRNHLVKNIDRWVIGAAFSFCQSRSPNRAFVRLSQDTMLDSMLPAWLETQVKNTGLDPAVLVFQVTQESAAAHLKQTRDMASRIKRIGFGFALDGFAGGPGAGQLLGHLPMDYLKIDGALMQGLAGDEELQDKVRAIVDQARGKNIRTIAERVEDANTMAVLWQVGVQYIQGYQIREPEVVLAENGR